LSKKQNFLTREEQQIVISKAGKEFRKVSKEIFALKSVQNLRRCLPRGIAFHNAGMLPDIKHIVEKLFAEGLIKVLFATETFAVGINMPAKTVCFDNMRKYTGKGFRLLNSKEYFQISGRAGRRGIDKKGLSVAILHRPSAELDKIAEFTSRDVLPLKSQFKLTYNTVLNMVHLHSPEENQRILRMNFYTFQKLQGRTDKRVLGSIKARNTKILKTLTKLGYIKDGKLTRIGLFATKIFSKELEISQIFAGWFNYDLDEYSILLLVAALTYEGRRGSRFYKTYHPKRTAQLLNVIQNHPVLKKGKWHQNLEKMSAIVEPCHRHKIFMDILKNTNMLEGDLIRLLMRVMDALEQIDNALDDDEILTGKVKNCKYLIRNSLEGIHVF
ncbi:MAG: helicase-related protein, partial [Candidatus Hydrothermarchaeales archaeon]